MAGVSSAAGFLVPALLNHAVSVPLVLSGFGIAFSTFALVMVGKSKKRPLGPMPDRLLTVLVVAGLVAVASAVAGGIITGGFSADNPAIGACKWSISTDHGGTVRCVSHERWLQVEHGSFT